MKLYFVWLGSGRARRQGIGRGGILLDEASRAGLPVPQGGILLNTFWQLALKTKTAEYHNNQLHITHPNQLHHLLYDIARFPRIDTPAIMRLLNLTHSHIPPLTNLTPDNPESLAHAITTLWTATPPLTHPDILIQTQINARHTGTAVTHPEQSHDLAYTPDHPDGLPLRPLRAWQFADKLPDHLRRLQLLLRGVRRTFGKQPWQISWQDDGRICWLTAIQPTTVGTTAVSD
ncbi:MAG: hypothetical protein D6706_12845 [Chloroflexi bacterium]|nr:MAG: hypothetical protein D6706_12845 [Chloroflexota bacterium]